MKKENLEKPTYGRWWSYAHGQWTDPFTGFRTEDKNEFANYIADKHGRKEPEYFLRNWKEFMSLDWRLQFPAYLEYLKKRSKVPQESK